MKILAFLSVIVSIGLLISEKEWIVLIVYFLIAVALIWGGRMLENQFINYNS
jgi:hypothetical protein